MADVLGKKISELAETTDLAGLYTIGSDRNNQSKKVPLQFVKEAADYANAQGDYAKGVGDTIQGNTGVNEYPAFSSSTQYAAGSVVRYNNKLYRFTALHPAGAWVGTDAIETSIKAETDVKLTELESETNGIKLNVGTTLELEFGSIDGGQNINSTKRVRTKNLVGQFKVKVADGYVIFYVSHYDMNGRYLNGALVDLQEYEPAYSDHLYRFTIRKNDNSEISADEIPNIIVSWSTGLLGKAVTIINHELSEKTVLKQSYESFEIGNNNKLNRVDGELNSILHLEKGSIRDGNNASSDMYIRCVGYICPPFSLELNDGYEVYYKSLYPFSNNGEISYHTGVLVNNSRWSETNKNYLYRFIVKKTDGTPFNDSEINNVVKSFKGKLDYLHIDNTLSLFSASTNLINKWFHGWELAGVDGHAYQSSGISTTGFVSVDVNAIYRQSRALSLYLYDKNYNFLCRIGSYPANTDLILSQNEISAPYKDSIKYIRTNSATANTDTYVFEKFENGKALESIHYDGDGDFIKTYDLKELDLINIPIKEDAQSVSMRFTTQQSLFHLANEKRVMSVASYLISVAPYNELSPGETAEPYFNTKEKCEWKFYKEGKHISSIIMRYNHYANDLFSVRLKYPVVQVNANGSTIIETPCPSEYELAYIKKTDSVFGFYYASGIAIKEFAITNDTSVDSLVDMLKNDNTINQLFEITRYASDGFTMSKIHNFDKIIVNKEMAEILYEQGADVPTPTGQVYYDAYPVFIRSTDVGYEHLLELNYNNGFAQFVIDGLVEQDRSAPVTSDKLSIFKNENDLIAEIKDLKILPYARKDVPLISMQHNVEVRDEITGEYMKTSTRRLTNILDFLQKLGYSSVNINDCYDIIKGNRAVNAPIYCLTFDDYQSNLWRDETIRKIFLSYGATPTLIQIVDGKDLDNDSPTGRYITKAEFDAIKAAGWGIIYHGFTMYTRQMSYAQYIHGFQKAKELWMRWYGEDVSMYNGHGQEPLPYQYFLLRHIGFKATSSADCPLGHYNSAVTPINASIKRVAWLDSEFNWEYVKGCIYNWIG